MLPSISVIMPSYNQVKYLELAIRSVLDQRYPGLELLVMDGGSTDGSIEVLNQYRDKLSFVSEKDGGQSAAINEGFRKAQGEIIGWLNSDDIYMPYALNRVGEYFDKNSDVEWLYGRCSIIDSEGQAIREWITRYKELSLRRFGYRKLLFENFISQPAVFFRRRLLEKVGPLDNALKYSMDYDLWLRMAEIERPAFIDSELAKFRSSGTNKMSTGFARSFEEELMVAKRASSGRYPITVAMKRANRYKLLIAYHVLRYLRK